MFLIYSKYDLSVCNRYNNVIFNTSTPYFILKHSVYFTPNNTATFKLATFKY